MNGERRRRDAIHSDNNSFFFYFSINKVLPPACVDQSPSHWLIDWLHILRSGGWQKMTGCPPFKLKTGAAKLFLKIDLPATNPNSSLQWTTHCTSSSSSGPKSLEFHPDNFLVDPDELVRKSRLSKRPSTGSAPTSNEDEGTTNTIPISPTSVHSPSWYEVLIADNSSAKSNPPSTPSSWPILSFKPLSPIFNVIQLVSR